MNPKGRQAVIEVVHIQPPRTQSRVEKVGGVNLSKKSVDIQQISPSVVASLDYLCQDSGRAYQSFRLLNVRDNV